MGLSIKVGGTRGTFEGPSADAIAEALDHAFGAEGEWEGDAPVGFGEQPATGWSRLQQQAAKTLGADFVPNLLALPGDGRGVYLPAPVRAMDLALKGFGTLRCASLPGLRSELEDLAGRWGIELDEDALRTRVSSAPDPGEAGDEPEAVALARLVLAANEAARRDCPLWLVGPGGA